MHGLSAPLLAIAALGWIAAALIAALSGGAFAHRLATGISVLAGLSALVCGGWAMTLHNAALQLRVGAGVVGLVELRLIPLAAVFLAALGLVSCAVGLYRWRDRGRGGAFRVYGLSYHLLLLGCLGVLVSGSVIVFLVSWEVMTLGCFLVILRRQPSAGVAPAALLFLALGEMGFVCIVGALAVLATQAHGGGFAAITLAAPRLAPGWRDAVFLLALVGFGFKAGIVPLHVAMPEADPAAPAEGAALLSGLVTKMGVFGFMLVALLLLPAGPVWWGLTVMSLGALSAALGVLYALMERDWKSFLAYSTVENLGVVFIALGASLTFFELHLPAVGALLLIAALYQVLNHACFKSLLFLTAGIVESATGLRNLDRLGGLWRRMPATAALCLVATLGISALPPLNGFVSEWLIFQGLFQGFRLPLHVAGVLVVVAAATLALSGGLAINAFARGFAFPFLGMARSEAAATATEQGLPLVGPSLLAAACIALSLGAPVVLTALDRAVYATTSVNILSRLLIPGLTVIPARQNFSAFSPTYLALCLLLMLAVPAVIALSQRRLAGARKVPVWDGGILRFRARMQYTATTHANPVRVTFDNLYRPHVQLSRASDDPAGRSGPVHYHFQVTPLVQRYLYRPAVGLVRLCARLAQPLQSGNVNQYLLYVFLAIVLAYLVAVH